jgi:hypothetical protein
MGARPRGKPARCLEVWSDSRKSAVGHDYLLLYLAILCIIESQPGPQTGLISKAADAGVLHAPPKAVEVGWRFSTAVAFAECFFTGSRMCPVTPLVRVAVPILERFGDGMLTFHSPASLL